MKLSTTIKFLPGHAGIDMELIWEAERLGFDAVWAGEAYGTDAVSPVAWVLARTERIKAGTSIMQMPARTPACAAMTAMTLQAMSGNRFRCGIGPSGPQVIEGWHGVPFGKPLGRTREYIAIIHQVLERKAPLEHQGEHYQIPYTGPGATGLGKPLKLMLRPLRADIPIMLGAEGPKNIALAAEICDGWLPIFYTPRMADMYNEWLDEGFARPGARRSREEFEVCATANIVITDDRSAALAAMKPYLALYVGGMGAEDTNFHADVYRRMGYADVVDDVTALFRTDRKDEAATVIPDELVDDSAIVGDLDYVRKQIEVWEAAGVTMMVVTGRNAEQIRELATLI